LKNKKETRTFSPSWYYQPLQCFVSNSTPLNSNTKNLVARDGYIATILKNRSDTLLNTMNFKMLGSSVAFGGRYGENSCGRIDFGCNCVIATCLLQREL
jgi:hypothetical protein